MSVLIVLEKIKEMIKAFPRKRNSIIKMVYYQKKRVKLTNTYLSKLKSVAKNKKGATLRLNMKSFEDEKLSQELFLTTRQTTKVRNGFADNFSTDIKLNKAQISTKIFKYSISNIQIFNIKCSIRWIFWFLVR